MGFKFKILDGSEYECPRRMGDIVLKDFIKLVGQIEKKMPEKMQAIFDEKDEEKRHKLVEELGEWEYQKYFVPYMAKVVSLLCKVPMRKIMGGEGQESRMNIVDLEMLYSNCMGCFAGWEFNEEFDGFDFEGVRYVMPKVHMRGSTVIEFLEASQYQHHYRQLEKGRWEAMPFVVAILARPEGEEYDSDKVEERGKKFLRLPLDVVWNVSFFLMRQNRRLRNAFLSSMIVRYMRLLKQA